MSLDTGAPRSKKCRMFFIPDAFMVNNKIKKFSRVKEWRDIFFPIRYIVSQDSRKFREPKLWGGDEFREKTY